MSGYLFAVITALLVVMLQEVLKKITKPTKAREVAFLVHVQGRTESNEHMDFAVSLYADESVGAWKEKLGQAFELREWRLKFQNERMLDLERQIAEENEKAGKAGNA